MGTSTTNWQDIGSGQSSSGGSWTESARQAADQARREGMEPQASGKPEQREGVIARTIEQQTAKLPSDTFLWAAIGSIGVSATLQLLGKQKASLFVGQWVAPFLLLGVYNKIVKVAGSDKLSG